jgi:hypothetical protein
MGQQRQKILKIEDEKYLVWYPEKWFELLRIGIRQYALFSPNAR